VRITLLVVALLSVADVAAAQAQLPPDLAYEHQLNQRLQWLNQQEYELMNDDVMRRYRRRKILGFTLGSAAAAGAYMTAMIYGFALDDESPSTAERRRFTAAGASLAVAAVVGFGVAIGSVVFKPHRQARRQLRLEQREVRQQLNQLREDRVARLRLSATGLQLRF
jgi:hypothetical protein